MLDRVGECGHADRAGHFQIRAGHAGFQGWLKGQQADLSRSES